MEKVMPDATGSNHCMVDMVCMVIQFQNRYVPKEILGETPSKPCHRALSRQGVNQCQSQPLICLTRRLQKLTRKWMVHCSLVLRHLHYRHGLCSSPQTTGSATGVETGCFRRALIHAPGLSFPLQPWTRHYFLMSMAILMEMPLLTK